MRQLLAAVLTRSRFRCAAGEDRADRRVGAEVLGAAVARRLDGRGAEAEAEADAVAQPDPGQLRVRAVRPQLHPEGLAAAPPHLRVRQGAAVPVPVLPAEVQAQGAPDPAHPAPAQGQDRHPGGEQPRSAAQAAGLTGPLPLVAQKVTIVVAECGFISALVCCCCLNLIALTASVSLRLSPFIVYVICT